MGLIKLFEKSVQTAKDKDALAAKLITIKTHDGESLVAFFERFYPDETDRKHFLKKYFSVVYPLYPAPLLSKIFGISASALRKTASRLNLRKAEYWTPEEDDFLLKNYKLKTNKELREYFGRTKWAIISRHQILTGKK